MAFGVLNFCYFCGTFYKSNIKSASTEFSKLTVKEKDEGGPIHKMTIYICPNCAKKLKDSKKGEV